MKNTLYFFILLLTSCSFKQTAKEAPATDSLTIVLDTLMINNEVYYLDSIDAKEFESIYSLLDNETKCIVDYGYNKGNETIDDSIHVTSNNEMLTFQLRNGLIDSCINDTTDGEEYTKYSYIKSYNNIDYWLINQTFYEGDVYYLLNKQYGKYISLMSEPLFSPNKKYFISYTCALETEYVATGMQLFEIKNKTVKELWLKELTEWSPSKIIWKNDSIIYMEQFRILENGNNQLSYKSMKIIK